MTAGELRAALDGVPDEREIVVLRMHGDSDRALFFQTAGKYRDDPPRIFVLDVRVVDQA